MAPRSLKPVEFIGESLDELRGFPKSARREAGFQLDLVQRGLEPADWKPMPGIGSGVCEMRIRDAAGAFRVVYVANSLRRFTFFVAFRKRARGPRRKI
jgi:phage-related protein